MHIMLKSIKNIAHMWLVRSQQYTGTDNLYIAKSGFWTSLPYFVGMVLAFFQILVFANFLPREIYGTYKYILSAASIFGFLTLTGMNTAVTQMTARGIEGILGYSIKLQLRFNILYTLAAIVVAVYYHLHNNTTLALGIAIIGFAFPISSALNTYGAYLVGKKDFRRLARYSILSNIFSSLALIATTIATQNIIAIVIAYSLGPLMPVAYFYIRMTRSMNVSLPSASERQELAKYSGHLSLLNVLSTIGQYLDKIIVFQYIGAVELAVYSIAQAIPQRIIGVIKSSTSFLLPKMSVRDLRTIRKVFYARVFQGMLLGIGIVALYWVSAPIIFPILLPKYMDSLRYSQFMSLVVVFMFPAAYMSSVFRGQKMLRVLYLSSLGGQGLRILLFLILGPLYGIRGLIVAAIATQVIGLIYNFVLWEYDIRHRARRGDFGEQAVVSQ